ncbi:hypothetical protein H1C71_027012, partial [Ictidomys tridecemlineatus]
HSSVVLDANAASLLLSQPAASPSQSKAKHQACWPCPVTWTPRSRGAMTRQKAPWALAMQQNVTSQHRRQRSCCPVPCKVDCDRTVFLRHTAHLGEVRQHTAFAVLAVNLELLPLLQKEALCLQLLLPKSLP